MAEIKINLSVMDMEIQMLNKMKSGWDKDTITIPEITNTGDMADNMRSVVNHYTQLNCMMNDLASTTIIFMNSLKDKYNDLNIETSKLAGMENIHIAHVMN